MKHYINTTGNDALYSAVITLAKKLGIVVRGTQGINSGAVCLNTTYRTEVDLSDLEYRRGNRHNTEVSVKYFLAKLAEAAASVPVTVDVVLNDEYTAVIFKDTIEVGCQTFPADILKKLKDAQGSLGSASSSLHNTYMHIGFNEPLDRLIQAQAFALGFGWLGNGSQYSYHGRESYRERFCLGFDGKQLMHCDLEWYQSRPEKYKACNPSHLLVPAFGVVPLNAEYTANVYSDKVTVGSDVTIPTATLDAMLAAHEKLNG